MSTYQPRQPYIFETTAPKPWQNAIPEEVLQLAYENVPLPPVQQTKRLGPNLQQARVGLVSQDEYAVSDSQEYENKLERIPELNSEDSLEKEIEEEVARAISEAILNSIVNKETRSVKDEEYMPTSQLTPEGRMQTIAEEAETDHMVGNSDASPEVKKTSEGYSRGKRDDFIASIPSEFLNQQQQQISGSNDAAQIRAQTVKEQGTPLKESEIHIEEVNPETVVAEQVNMGQNIVV